jgi:hypothetical protein
MGNVPVQRGRLSWEVLKELWAGQRSLMMVQFVDALRCALWTYDRG